MVSLPICGNAGGLNTEALLAVCSSSSLGFAGSLYRQSYVPSVGSREEENAFVVVAFFLDDIFDDDDDDDQSIESRAHTNECFSSFLSF